MVRLPAHPRQHSRSRRRKQSRAARPKSMPCLPHPNPCGRALRRHAFRRGVNRRPLSPPPARPAPSVSPPAATIHRPRLPSAFMVFYQLLRPAMRLMSGISLGLQAGKPAPSRRSPAVYGRDLARLPAAPLGFSPHVSCAGTSTLGVSYISRSGLISALVALISAARGWLASHQVVDVGHGGCFLVGERGCAHLRVGRAPMRQGEEGIRRGGRARTAAFSCARHWVDMGKPACDTHRALLTM